LAQSSPKQGTMEDDDDDMPPLEYVGHGASTGVSLLEGDRVRLQGLTKPGLDGQIGTLQSFAKAAKGRLPVKLDSGQLLAVKPENLDKLQSGHGMNGVGPKTAPVEAAAPPAAPKAAVVEDDDDDDDMPPLEYVGTGKGAATEPPPAAPVSAPKQEPARPAPARPAAMPPLQSISQASPMQPEIPAPAPAPLPKSPEVDSFLEKMKVALHSAKLASIDEALRIGNSAGLQWGDRNLEKNMLMQRLNTLRTELVTKPAPKKEVQANGYANGNAANGTAPVSSDKGVLESWCEELQLPGELLARLRAEEVMEPQELTGVTETELTALTAGLKIGPKGRFMKAVQRMKALEAAELRSIA